MQNITNGNDESSLRSVYITNNFDFLRLLFASLVIISHSSTLLGIKEHSIFSQVTHHNIIASNLRVKGFFSISGYLVFYSLQRSKNLLDFFWRRIIRIFPGLIVVLMASVMLASFVYTGSTPFYKNSSVYTYVPNNLSIYNIQFLIKGVFEDQPQKAVNGSLWTLPYEFTFYILLSSLLFVRSKKVSAFLISAALILLIGISLLFAAHLGKYYFHLSTYYFVSLGTFFGVGCFLASINLKSSKHLTLMAVASFLLLFTAYATDNRYIVESVEYVTYPLAIICFGLSSTPIIKNIGKRIGDLSYGTYVYSFPVQQTLIHYFKLSFAELAVYSLLISYGFAYLSWHLVESKALRYKNLLAGSPVTRLTRPALNQHKNNGIQLSTINTSAHGR